MKFLLNPNEINNLYFNDFLNVQKSMKISEMHDNARKVFTIPGSLKTRIVGNALPYAIFECKEDKYRVSSYLIITFFKNSVKPLKKFIM